MKIYDPMSYEQQLCYQAAASADHNHPVVILQTPSEKFRRLSLTLTASSPHLSSSPEPEVLVMALLFLSSHSLSLRLANDVFFSHFECKLLKKERERQS